MRNLLKDLFDTMMDMRRARQQRRYQDIPSSIPEHARSVLDSEGIRFRYTSGDETTSKPHLAKVDALGFYTPKGSPPQHFLRRAFGEETGVMTEKRVGGRYGAAVIAGRGTLTAPHEAGHAVDDVLRNTQLSHNSQRFRNLCTKYQAGTPGGGGMGARIDPYFKSCLELYAGMLAEFWDRPNALRSYDPQMFAFMRDVDDELRRRTNRRRPSTPPPPPREQQPMLSPGSDDWLLKAAKSRRSRLGSR